MFPVLQRDYTVMVVTLTYNHAPYIEDTLKGIVMQQTNFPVVACVLDDCSTDGTADIVRRYEAQYPDLIKGFYYDENQFSQGKFTGEVLASWVEKVKYIALCEGDDYWTDPLKLQKQVDFMNKNRGYSLCFHNALVHWEGVERLDTLFYNIETRNYSGEEVYEKWVIPTASIMFRTNVLMDCDIQRKLSTKGLLALDYALVLSCSIKGKLYGMSDVMSVYRKTNDGFTLRSGNDRGEANLACMKYADHYLTMIQIFGDYYKSIAERDFYRLCIGCMIVNIKKLNCVMALKFFLKSINYSVTGTSLFILKFIKRYIKNSSRKK